MEEGGFIMVVPEQERANRGRGTDGISTQQGISEQNAEKYLQKKLIEQKTEDQDQMQYESNRKKKE